MDVVIFYAFTVCTGVGLIETYQVHFMGGDVCSVLYFVLDYLYVRPG